MQSTNNEDLSQQKEVAYYSALVSAWIETRMEFDKSLVMLSTGAIGLLVTILSTVGVSNKWLLTIYSGAFISFLLCIISCLRIFNRNTKLIESLIGDKQPNNYRLSRLDIIALSSFLSGILFSISIGVIAGFQVTHVNRAGENIMPARVLQLKGRDELISDSLDGIDNLKPKQEREPDISITPSPASEESTDQEAPSPPSSNDNDSSHGDVEN